MPISKSLPSTISIGIGRGSDRAGFNKGEEPRNRRAKRNRPVPAVAVTCGQRLSRFAICQLTFCQSWKIPEAFHVTPIAAVGRHRCPSTPVSRDTRAVRWRACRCRGTAGSPRTLAPLTAVNVTSAPPVGH